jgi:large conductance mechanosensitive channel
MLKGFKEFMTRGNVIDLAVAVIIGTAFTAVVTSVVGNLINPLIAAMGGGNVNGLAVQLNADNKKTVIDFGAIITALINFVLIAAVVYFFIVVPVKKIIERRKRGEEPPSAEPTEAELLTEIRDLLRQQASR